MKTHMRFSAIILLLSFTALLQAQPVANFSFSQNCNTVDFVNTSTGATSYMWDFNDGSTSTQQNPTHVFPFNGSFAVTLTVSDGISQDSITKVIFIPGPSVSTVAVTLCEGDSFFFGNNWHYSTGGAADTLLSASGCDSVLILELTVLPVFIVDFAVTLCPGDSFFTGGAWQFAVGTYYDTLVSNFGCDSIHIVSLWISGDVPVTADSVIDATCGTCDGKIDLQQAGPVGYIWSTGDTGAVIAGLCPGEYFVTAVNTEGCYSTASFIVNGNAACFDTISGTVYRDLNGNCVQDTGESGLPGVLIDITPGGGIYTDTNGKYQFIRDTGTYVVAEVIPQYHNVICPSGSSYTITLSAPGLHSSGNDFANQVIPILDVRASLFCGVARPGFTEQLSFTIRNSGTIPATGHIEFTLDNRLTFIAVNSPTPSPDSIDVINNKFYWSYNNLDVQQSLVFTFRAQIPPPPMVSIGDTIINGITVFPLTGDVDSSNNSGSCAIIVTGGYDPNDKAVSPAGEGAQGYIEQHDTLMYYTIRFQNTGTDTAFNVVIKDTLDSSLDYRSFKAGTASHPYTVHFEEDDVLVFTFEDILLPDSNVNEPGSNGHVTFFIEHLGTLPIGETITNSAAIYFDFNPPVITNTVSNRIYDPVGVKEVSVTGNIKIYPNPAQHTITIESEGSAIRAVAVSDMLGRKYYGKEKLDASSVRISFADLLSGIYLVETVLANNIRERVKLIKQ